MPASLEGLDHGAAFEYYERLSERLRLPTESNGKLLLGPRTLKQMPQDLPLGEAERPVAGHTVHLTVQRVQ